MSTNTSPPSRKEGLGLDKIYCTNYYSTNCKHLHLSQGSKVMVCSACRDSTCLEKTL